MDKKDSMKVPNDGQLKMPAPWKIMFAGLCLFTAGMIPVAIGASSEISSSRYKMIQMLSLLPGLIVTTVGAICAMFRYKESILHKIVTWIIVLGALTGLSIGGFIFVHDVIIHPMEMKAKNQHQQSDHFK